MSKPVQYHVALHLQSRLYVAPNRWDICAVSRVVAEPRMGSGVDFPLPASYLPCSNGAPPE
jgi:hypothetical protein